MQTISKQWLNGSSNWETVQSLTRSKISYICTRVETERSRKKDDEDAVVDDAENGEHEVGGKEWVFGKMIFMVYSSTYGTSSAAAVLINAPYLPVLWKIVEKILSAERCHVYL